ncbi:hypothetical protein ABMA70_05035 [Halobacteriovorax sp. XZX-3]|uniref:hypothetical protein n=1 Tax=unclassified Halobacteriovorax TaxID=2639665 RepID=UPI0037140AB6
MSNKKEECFVIMPISGNDDRSQDHFLSVYHDIIRPACDIAGFKAIRADDVKSTNLIHVDIIKRIIEAPLAICDLSTRNPNVLFELGIRQAFDKPVVLIQEKNTKKIFDINILRIYEYSSSLIYKNVLEDQKEISDRINDTMKNVQENGHINSLIKLLSIPNPAQIQDTQLNSKQVFEIIEMLKGEISEISSFQRKIQYESKRGIRGSKRIMDPMDFFQKLDRYQELFKDFKRKEGVVTDSFKEKISSDYQKITDLYLNNGDRDYREIADRYSELLTEINRYNSNLFSF